MKSFRAVSILILFVFVWRAAALASEPAAGFFLPDSIQAMILKYRVSGDLIVLPVTINDSVQVNLVLDTGCRNLILFGKKFKKRFDFPTARKVQFSGLGEGAPLTGSLALNNNVRIANITGERIPIVVVPDRHIFESKHKIDGVIGYDVFLRFEIELNPAQRTITFRPAQHAEPPADYTTVGLKVVDARPVLESTVYMGKRRPKTLQLMIDTGSTLGLLLKTTDILEFGFQSGEQVLGVGLNGPITGLEIISDKLQIEELEITGVQTGIVSSKWHDNASIGMDVLKNYIVILNYAKQYACFKSNHA